MALTRAALRERGITEKEILDYIMEEHGNTVEAAKEKTKEDTEKAAQKKNDALQEQLDSMPKPDSEGKDWKAEYETLKASTVDKTVHDTLKSEFDTYKSNVETEKAAAKTDSELSEMLKNAGFNEKSLGDLLNDKRFDRSIAKRGKDGNISNGEEIVSAVKSLGNWGSHFGTFQTVGAGVATPPKAEPAKPAGHKDMNAFIRGVAE